MKPQVIDCCGSQRIRWRPVHVLPPPDSINALCREIQEAEASAGFLATALCQMKAAERSWERYK